MQDGTYTLQDCGDLADYMDVSRFDLYQTVDFEVYTASSGQQKCTVILSVDGTYCGAYPVKTTLDNWSDHTLKEQNSDSTSSAESIDNNIIDNNITDNNIIDIERKIN